MLGSLCTRLPHLPTFPFVGSHTPRWGRDPPGRVRGNLGQLTQIFTRSSDVACEACVHSASPSSAASWADPHPRGRKPKHHRARFQSLDGLHSRGTRIILSTFGWSSIFFWRQSTANIAIRFVMEKGNYYSGVRCRDHCVWKSPENSSA